MFLPFSDQFSLPSSVDSIPPFPSSNGLPSNYLLSQALSNFSLNALTFGWLTSFKDIPSSKKNTLLPAYHVANLERIKYLPCFFLLPQVATRSTAPTVTLWNFNHHHGEVVMSKATHLMHEASWKSVHPLVQGATSSSRWSKNILLMLLIKAIKKKKLVALGLKKGIYRGVLVHNNGEWKWIFCFHSYLLWNENEFVIPFLVFRWI